MKTIKQLQLGTILYFFLLLTLTITSVPICANAAADILTGTITDRVTNAPIVGATVQLYGQGYATTQTDGNGNYSFSAQQWPNTGSTSLFVQSPQGHFSIQTTVNIAAPFPMTQNVTLLPGGTVLGGTVTDASTNQPIANAGVSYNSSNVMYLVGGGLTISTTTDLAGNYAFDCSRFVESVATAGSSGSLSVGAANYFGASISVNVLPPYPFAKDFALTPLPGVVLTGTITDRATNAPIVGATVQLYGQGYATTQTDGNGIYSFSGLQWPNIGSTSLFVQSPQGHFSIQTTVSIAAPFPTTQNVTLLPGGTVLGGTVTDASTNQPIANAGVSYNSSNVMYLVGGGLTISTTTDLAGNYAFDCSKFVESVATAGSSGSLGVSAANYFGASTSVNVSPPYPFAKDFALTPLSGVVLTGIITDRATNAPIVGATVQLYGQGYATTQTDGNGIYSFSGLQWPNIGSTSLFVQSPQGHFSIQTTVNIAAPFPMTQNVTLLPGGTVLGGTVTDASTNQPIANAGVSYNSSNVMYLVGGGLTISTTTDLAGNYAFDCSRFVESVATAGSSGSLGVSAQPGFFGFNNSINIIPPLPLTVNASLTQTGATSAITFDTIPTGLSITVDNTPYTAPQSFTWISNTVHTIATISSLPIAQGSQLVFKNWSDSGAVSHAIATPSIDSTISASFTTQYLLTTATSPSSGGSVTSGGWFNSNSSVNIQATPSSGYLFAGFSGALAGPGNPQAIIMDAPKNITANFIVSSYTLSYTAGANGSISGSTSQNVPAGGSGTQVTAVANSRYVFVSWSDGLTTASRTDANVTANISVTASFAPLQPTISGTPASSVMAGVAYSFTPTASNAGSFSIANMPAWMSFNSATGAVSGTPGAGNVGTFSNIIISALNGTLSASLPQFNITVTAAVSTVTIQTSPTGRNFRVDGVAYSSTQTFTWIPGSIHTIATTSSQGGGGTRYIFNNWSDGGAISHSITAAAGTASFTASFDTQYRLTTSVSPGGSGTVTPTSGGYFAAGSIVNLLATPVAPDTFGSWTGPVASAASAATTVTMTAPVTVRANMLRPPLLTAGIAGKSGPIAARVWNISLSNGSGHSTANAARINGLTFTQTAGAACTPVITSPPAFPLVVGNIGSGSSASANVTINFTGCANASRFTVVIPSSSDGGAYSWSRTFTNQAR